MNLKQRQVIEVFESPMRSLVRGLWFSGKYNNGEYMDWWRNGNLQTHCFYKNSLLHGEFKSYDRQGILTKHKLYKNDELIKDFME